MKKTYDLYGFLSEDLDELANVLGKALGISFFPHESSYHCGDYYVWEDSNGEEEFILQHNRDPFESDPSDAWTEPDFKEYPTLLYAEDTVRSGEVERVILETLKEGASLLRRESLDADLAEDSS